MTVFDSADEQQLAHNKILGLLPELGKEWRVSFEFRPTSYEFNEVANLIQLTTGGVSTEHGSMTPTISFEKGNNEKIKMFMITSMNLNANFYFQLGSVPVPKIGEWTKIEVDQRQEGCGYVVAISLANKEVSRIENLRPRKFSNVIVLASNAVDEVQPGSIRQLTISSDTGEILQ